MTEEECLDKVIAKYDLEARGKRSPAQWAEEAPDGGLELARDGYRYAVSKLPDSHAVDYALHIASRRLAGEIIG